MKESWLTSAFGDSNGLFSARNYILTDTNQDTSEGINTSQRDGWLTNNGNTEYYAGVAYATAEAVVLLNPSGNKITYANVAPVDATAGDLWYEVNNNYKMYRYDGNGWAVAVLNGDNITVGTIDANAVNVSNINAGNITSGLINAARINVQDIITTGNLVAVDEVNGLVTSISGNAITTGTINAARLVLTGPDSIGANMDLGDFNNAVGFTDDTVANNAQSTANNAQSTANTVSSNLSSLETNLGSLAYDNLVETAKLGSTILVGGYLKTNLIEAGTIAVNKLVSTGTSTTTKGVFGLGTGSASVQIGSTQANIAGSVYGKANYSNASGILGEALTGGTNTAGAVGVYGTGIYGVLGCNIAAGYFVRNSGSCEVVLGSVSTGNAIEATGDVEITGDVTVSGKTALQEFDFLGYNGSNRMSFEWNGSNALTLNVDSYSFTIPVSHTSGHYGYSEEDMILGDIVYTSSTYLMDMSQSIPDLKTTTTVKDNRVIGVAVEYGQEIEPLLTLFCKSKGDFISSRHEELFNIAMSRVDEIKVCKTNSIGEGGVNVCEANGDIINGDYICSSNIRGKGQKQDDDLMHNYTVAKASEDVIWADQVIGEAGVFEQDGVMCKMIACTYHCG